MKTTPTDKYPGLPSWFRSLLLPAAALSLFSATAFSQEVAPATAAGEADEEVVELSPFVIDAESETGWVASETLAGSRLKSKFSDIAAPIEVLTMDFMDDYGLNSIEDAAKYTVNVESGDDITLGNGLPGSTGSGTVRIRGLAAPTNSREFFGSLMPSDNYNIDRLTVASGPNSILFGTGSPAGVIDSSLKRPTFKNGGTVGLQVDSFGGYRGTLDYNQVLVDNVLSVRANALYGVRSWDIEDADETSKRINVGVTWKPFKNTTFFANYEYTDIDSSRPSTLWPTDQMTTWYESSTYGLGGGYPSRYIFPNDAAWAAGGDGVAERYLPPNPSQGVAPVPGMQQQLFDVAGNFPVVIDGANAISQIWGWQNSVDINQVPSWNHISPINNEADGWTILSDKYYPVDVNTLANVRGANTKWDTFNFNFSQKIIEDLYFDAAYQYQKQDLFSWEKINYISAQTPTIDANMYLPDGVTPNPNAGKVYFQGYPAYSKGVQEVNDWRLALSYELDFVKKTERFGWLGKHRLAALLSGFQSEQREQAYRYHIQPKEEAGGWRDPVFPGMDYAVDTLHEGINVSPLLSSPYQTSTTNGVSSIRFNNAGEPIRQNNSAWRTSAQRRPQVRYYLEGNEFIPNHFIPSGEPWTITDANGEAWTMTPEEWYVEDGVRWVSREGFAPQGKTKQDTQQFTYQGYFWGGRIVATYGYREDKIKAASLDYINDQQNGVQENFFDVDFGEYGESESGTTQTKGIVAYPFQGWLHMPLGFDIGGFYNESDTYQPPTRNYDPYGGLYPGALGDGQDYGVIISMFDGKLTGRFNIYENSSGPQRAGNVPFNRFRFTFNGPFNRVTALAPSIEGTSGWPTNVEGTRDRVYNELGAGDPYWVVSFREATGQELQLNWKPVNNLDLRFTWNSQDVVESQIGLDWWNFLDTITPIIDSYGFPEGGETDPSDKNGDGVITQNVTWKDAPWQQGQWSNFVPGAATQSYTTVKQQWDNTAINGSTGRGIIEALDGKANEFVRENRWNLNANYRFTEGALKGFDVGGAVRWRAAPLIGYGDKVQAGTTIVDLDNPIYGSQEVYYDFRAGYRGQMAFMGDRNYRINLNVRNVFDKDEGLASMASASGQAIRYRRVDGRQFILSLEFDL
ncbi:MAG: hypothetical protein R3F07_16215 [Opitutaceae bacterium]